MSVKLRLQRHGRKKYAYFHIVAADSRAPRNGRFIERLGLYNPNTNPATIELDFDKTLAWFQKGAQPTDTMNAILAYKGVLFKNHLLGGVKKGALTLEQAEAKFAEWQQAKEAKVNAKKGNLTEAKASTLKERMKAETEANQSRARKIEEKRMEAIKAAEKSEETASEETAPENSDEAPEEKHS